MVEEGTWTPQPLPLYNSEGILARPHQYSTTLPGSLACVKFSLTRHWNGLSQAYDYHANVEEINLVEKARVEMGRCSHTKLVENVHKRNTVRTDSI